MLSKQNLVSFEGSLKKVQERLQQSEKEISNLITTRTNVMNRKLRNINEIDNSKSSELLGIDNE